MVTRNYTSFSLDPTLKLSEMTEHLRRDDDNPSEDLRGRSCHFTLVIHYFPILILCSCFDTICIVKSAI